MGSVTAFSANWWRSDKILMQKGQRDGWTQQRKCSFDSISPHTGQNLLSSGFWWCRTLPVGRRQWTSFRVKWKQCEWEEQSHPRVSQSMSSVDVYLLKARTWSQKFISKAKWWIWAGRCWIQRFYFVFAHIVLYCFLCHIYDFFHICCVTFIISSVLYTQLVVCQVIVVFHFRLLNRTYGRICWISTECINRLPVINDRGTIVYLWFCMQCSKRHRHKKYDVCCKLLCLLPEYKIDRENNRNYQTIT